MCHIKHRVADAILLKRIAGMNFTRINGDDLPGSATLVGTAVPDSSNAVIDHADGPGFMTMTGIFVNKLYRSKAFKVGNLRHRPGACDGGRHGPLSMPRMLEPFVIARANTDAASVAEDRAKVAFR